MSSEQSSSTCERKELTHQIQLQLYDGITFPVDGTQFWVSVKIVKEGNKVTISFPTINFQTGPIANGDFFGPLPGGTLRTSDGFLPEDFRPSDPVYRSYLVPSNNGMSLPFSFATPPADLPVPITGYILSITFFGGIIISGAGTFLNLIPPGPQVVLPTDISYVISPVKTLCKNFPLSPVASNITQFPPGSGAAQDGYRDSHVNDAFDGIFAWTWTDNSAQIDKSNETMDTIVVIGRIKNGKLKLGKPINLTNFGPKIQSWDTAVAINRTDKYTIVVSYGVIDRSQQIVTVKPYRAVLQSPDQGKTWTIVANGPTNIQPTGNPSQFGDNRGVSADKFGNIWYGTTNRFDNTGDNINQPTFWISVDKGLSFSVAYTTPLPSDIGLVMYDFPQFCFGGDGQGHYGLWWCADAGNDVGDIIPATGFIPITGLGLYGPASSVQLLASLVNTQNLPGLSASQDGRVWCCSYADTPTFFEASVIRFKSPGPIDSNYAGPWQLNLSNYLSAFLGVAPYVSYPDWTYFNSVQIIIYDETRSALYALFSARAPDFSQNMRLYLLISRDNGQTWSNPIYIATTDFANRGFQSMALDPVSGNLVFGWYDGRNDKTEQSMQYFGAVLSAKTLNKLVEKIPLSNPLYTLPPATAPLPQSKDVHPAFGKIVKKIRERFHREN